MTKVFDKQIICDDSNNPPSVTEQGFLVVTVSVRLGPGPDFHSFDLPIDLEALEKGKVLSVPVAVKPYDIVRFRQNLFGDAEHPSATLVAEHDALTKLRKAVLAYDALLESCSNDPAKMSSAVSAEGDDLDTLYARMVILARGLAIFDCGCSWMKVNLGKCDVYDETGRERS